MSELEEKLGTLLKDPNMMQQIMGMANMLSNSQKEEPRQEPKTAAPSPQIDANLLKALSGLASQSGVDQQQDSLLKALQPYLHPNKLNKLERAMSAARMAGAASAFLNAGGLRMISTR